LQKPYNFETPTPGPSFLFFLSARPQCPFSQPPAPFKCADIKSKPHSGCTTGQQQQPAGSSPVTECPSVTTATGTKHTCTVSLPEMNAKTDGGTETHLHMSTKYQAEVPITTRAEEHAFFTLRQHATGTKKSGAKKEGEVTRPNNALNAPESRALLGGHRQLKGFWRKLDRRDWNLCWSRKIRRGQFESFYERVRRRSPM